MTIIGRKELIKIPIVSNEYMVILDFRFDTKKYEGKPK